mmetsp:Transcript_21505/g.54157  ORF Transcript_21505/g.54157 Transcript_21505/m.54157 type:complete len:419 (-) Transcript_21505:200-1456(-)|eukprot:g12596.t1
MANSAPAASAQTYWQLGATTRLDGIFEKARQDVGSLENVSHEYRSVLNQKLFELYGAIEEVTKQRRGFEDNCIKIEMELDNCNEQLSLIDREDLKVQYREDRKEVLRVTERLIAVEAEEKRKWAKVLEVLKENFDLAPMVAGAGEREQQVPAANGGANGGFNAQQLPRPPGGAGAGAAARSNERADPRRNMQQDPRMMNNVDPRGDPMAAAGVGIPTSDARTPAAASGATMGTSSRDPRGKAGAGRRDDPISSGHSSFFDSMSTAANKAGRLFEDTFYGGTHQFVAPGSDDHEYVPQEAWWPKDKAARQHPAYNGPSDTAAYGQSLPPPQQASAQQRPRTPNGTAYGAGNSYAPGMAAASPTGIYGGSSVRGQMLGPGGAAPASGTPTGYDRLQFSNTAPNRDRGYNDDLPGLGRSRR